MEKKLPKKKRDIIQSIFTDNNGMKLEINNRSQTGKVTKLWKSKQQTFKQPVDQRTSLKGNLKIETNKSENTIC